MIDEALQVEIPTGLHTTQAPTTLPVAQQLNHAAGNQQSARYQTVSNQRFKPIHLHRHAIQVAGRKLQALHGQHRIEQPPRAVQPVHADLLRRQPLVGRQLQAIEHGERQASHALAQGDAQHDERQDH